MAISLPPTPGTGQLPPKKGKTPPGPQLPPPPPTNTGYLSFQGVPISASGSAGQAVDQVNGGWFKASPGYDTALLIAAAPSSNSPPPYHFILAHRIIGVSQNKKLKLRSINQKIKHGKNVWIPTHTGTPGGFSALCGDNPPTIIDGYGTWATVPRPLMRGLTVFQGYNPAQMTVGIKFGRWDALSTSSQSGWRGGINDPQTDLIGQQIEKNISTLEHMAGSTSKFNSGPPMVIYIASYDPGGGQNDLIPIEYQHTPGTTNPMQWVIDGGIQWGQAWRNVNADRIYQEATFTLTQYIRAA